MTTGKWCGNFWKGGAALPSDWNFETAAGHLKKKLILPDPQKVWNGVSIDTRTIKSGEVFFALKGEKQDGHDYLWDAFRKGASGAVIDEAFFKSAREKLFRERTLFHNLLPVSNTEEALGTLASHYRTHFSALGVAVTGSIGKTSTKEFLKFLLQQKYPILASSGNLNNHLGLPLTLFRLKPEHPYCVAELGANHKGEIRMLSSLLRPKVGIITGVAPTHLEGFGSLNNIYEAKLELVDFLSKNQGTLVLPDRDPELTRRARKRKLPILFFGTAASSDLCLSNVRAQEGWIDFEVNDRWNFRFPGYASFQAENALAALTACFACGISPGEFPSIWKDVEFPRGRFEILSPRPGILFINDGYNANPYSFQKAIEVFDAMESNGRKILVLGDMLELGPESGHYHRMLGKWISEKNFQAILTTGEWARETALTCEAAGDPPLALHFEDKGMLAHFLEGFLKTGDQVLFKASRGIRLEEIIDVLSSPIPIKRIPSRI